MAMLPEVQDELRAEINITPLVDVVLVLLVIFMVVTPLLKPEVPIELPVADTSQPATSDAPLTLTMTADGTLFLNHEPMPSDALVPQLSAIYVGRADKTIFIEADHTLAYGRVVELMDGCRSAGVTSIGVITKKEHS